MQKIFVVDGYSILFRTYYSVGEMNTSANIPIGGVFGFVRTILMLIQRYAVENLVVALDSGKKTFRSELYQEYKANRAAAPESLIPQFAIIREFLEEANICHFQIDGFEADDIIASVTAKEKEKHIAIVTSDKDLLQLVDERITCLDFFKNKVYQVIDVLEKFGIEPKFVVDYLALLGDASDNIPGVKGCGSKGAVKLIKEFGTVESILQNIHKMPNSKTRLIMEENRESAILSKRLASLRFDVPLSQIKCDLTEINFESMRKFLEKYEMKSLFYMLEKIALSRTSPQKNLVKSETSSIQGQLL